jgi:hypothetical protein
VGPTWKKHGNTVSSSGAIFTRVSGKIPKKRIDLRIDNGFRVKSSLRFCQVAGYKFFQHFDLPCNHFLFQVLNTTAVQPPHPITIYDSEIWDDLPVCNFTQRANLTVLRNVKTTFKIRGCSSYLAQHRTFSDLGLYFDHSPFAHIFGLHHSSNFYHNAILDHNSLSFVCGSLALKPDRASFTNDTIATHSYGCMGRIELCSWVDDGIGSQGYEMRASEGGVLGDD